MRKSYVAGKKNGGRKITLLIVSLVLIITAVTGGTIAFLTMSTNPITNIFSRSFVATEIHENFVKQPGVVGGQNVNLGIKSDVKVRNAGNTEAYIRAAIIVTWKNSEGHVYGKLPSDSDYSISINTNNGWTQGRDGFYYWTKPVSCGEDTDLKTYTGVLINSVEALAEAGPAAGYYLDVQIIASGIQSKPNNVVGSVWNTAGISSVSDDGTLIFGS